ncbi:MAG: NAD(P)H-dependent oxidoreductase subunit E [Chloroflexota bacterium]
MTDNSLSGRRRRWTYQPDPLAGGPAPDLAGILAEQRGVRGGLIPALERIQDRYGYLPPLALQHAARVLGVPLSRVYGVATFYNLFRLRPPGRSLVRICKGTACHVGGSARLLTAAESQLGIHEAETTPDGAVTLESVACMGACSLAPVVVVGDTLHGRQTIDSLRDLLRTLVGTEAPTVEGGE